MRGSIVDVYPVDRRPPGAHRPVGRRGRPALASSRSPTSARPTTSTEVEIFPVPRAAADRRGARPGPRELVATQPWGREQWERLAEGQTFDGMESWLPWLTADEHLLPDLLPDDALGAARRAPPHARPGRRSCSPRRPRWPSTLASTWGARRRATTARACSLPFDRLLAHTKAPARSGRSPRPTARHAACSPRARSTRWSATATRSSRQLRDAARPTATASCVAADGAGSARPHRATLLADEGVDRRASTATPTLARPAARRGRAARAGLRAARRQARGAGRGRPHRPPARRTAGRARRARRPRLLRRPEAAATTSCTTSTASAATAAW